MKDNKVNERIENLMGFADIVVDGIEKMKMPPHEMMCFVEGISRYCAKKIGMSTVEFLSYIRKGIEISEVLDCLLDDKNIWDKKWEGGARHE